MNWIFLLGAKSFSSLRSVAKGLAGQLLLLNGLASFALFKPCWSLDLFTFNSHSFAWSFLPKDLFLAVCGDIIQGKLKVSYLLLFLQVQSSKPGFTFSNLGLISRLHLRLNLIEPRHSLFDLVLFPSRGGDTESLESFFLLLLICIKLLLGNDG